MSTFVGIIGTIILVVLVCRGVMFVLKIGRHAARDISRYANEQPYNTPREKPVAHVRPTTVTWSAEEIAYNASHVPESAKRKPRV